MIVDTNTRIWDTAGQLGDHATSQHHRRRTPPWQRMSASPSVHKQAMAPVQHALVLGLESHLIGASISMDDVLGYVQLNAEKSIGVPAIDPLHQPVDRMLDRVEAEPMFKAVTISPCASGFHPANSEAMDLYERCADKGLPVIVEVGSLLARQARLEFSQPVLFDEIARTFDRLRIVFTGLGELWVDQALTMCAKHPTVFADISGIVRRPIALYHTLLAAHQTDVIGQLLFASGFPTFTPEQAIHNIYSVNTLVQGTSMPTIPREQLRSIVERDALATLRMAEEAAGRPAHVDSADDELPDDEPMTLARSVQPMPKSGAKSALSAQSSGPDSGEVDDAEGDGENDHSKPAAAKDDAPDKSDDSIELAADQSATTPDDRAGDTKAGAEEHAQDISHDKPDDTPETRGPQG